MAGGFRELKRLLRRTVHDTLAIEGLYQDSHAPLPVPVLVRWHTKSEFVGNLDGQGYAHIIENADALIFDTETLGRQGIVLRKGGQVTFGPEQLVFQLDSRRPSDGPVTTTWTVGLPSSIP